jgi:site-specific DNA recombinase
MIHALSDLTGLLRDADPVDKAELYGRMGLMLTYHPEKRTVEARVQPDLHRMCRRLVSEG